MGKAALFAISALVIMGTYYGISTQRGMLDTTGRVAEHQYEVLARNAALAGFNRAKQHLADSFTGISGETKSYEEGKYTLDIKISGSYADVVSRGQAGAEDYTVFATIQEEKIYPILQEAPKFMQYGLMSGSDLTVDGTVLFDMIRVTGTDELQYNANIHTNGKLTVKGAAAEIRGFGTHVQGVNVLHPDVFMPYENTTNDPVIQKVAPVQLPNFDPTAIAMTLPVDSTSNSYASLAGNYDFRTLGQGTRENPYIWFVNGDLFVNNINTVGYAMFLVTGNIYFDGTAKVSEHIGPSESNLAFYSGGNVTIDGNAEVWGQIYCNGAAMFSNGTPKVVGNVTTAAEAKFNGTPDILYLPASPALTKIFQDPEVRLKMRSIAER